MRPQLVLLFLIFVFGLIKAADLSEESAFLVLANSQQNDKLHQLYQKIPASLMTHLEVEQIVRPIQFRSNFDVNGVGVGVESHLVLLNFEIHLRESIETEFKSMRFEEIRAEDLSSDITKHYRNKVLERPQQGETAKAIIKFEKVYKGRAGEKRIAAVTANVYMEITERFEKNWFATNQRRFDYRLELNLIGTSAYRQKLNILRELLEQNGVSEVAKYVQSKVQISYDDL